MERTYFCKQKTKGYECGETNPEKFSVGRYSACKDCRKKFVRDYNKTLYEASKIDKELSLEEKLSDSKSMEELAKNTVDLVNKVVETKSLRLIGVSIPEKFEEHEIKFKQIYTQHKLIEEEHEKEIQGLKRENRQLKKENEEIRQQNTVIINKQYELEKIICELQKIISEITNK